LPTHRAIVRGPAAGDLPTGGVVSLLGIVFLFGLLMPAAALVVAAASAGLQVEILLADAPAGDRQALAWMVGARDS
jgi:hypothetical protein